MKFTPVRSLLAGAVVVIGGTVIAARLGSTPAPAPRTYVGEQTCMQSGCHADATGSGSIYAGATAFKQTMHQKIHLRLNPETCIMEKYFAGDSVLTDYDANRSNVGDTLDVFLSKSADGKEYYAQMKLRRSGDTTEKMKVAYTYGGNGWIQRYLVERDGHFYVLPFQYVLPAYRERTDTSNTFYWLDVDRWMDGDPNTGKMSFFKVNSNKFRFKAWDVACSPCHVNGFDLKVTGTPDDITYDTVSTDPLKIDTIRTSHNDSAWTSQWVGRGVDSSLQDMNISIGCESCHGPGSEHAANPTKDNIVSPSRFGNTPAGIDLKLDLCNQCHNRMKSTANHYVYPYDEANKQPYTPGLPLKDFAYKGNIFIGPQMWPDSTSKAHHQQGQDFARSSEYQNHLFSDGCWSCHTIHYNTQYPYQLDRDWYTVKSGEGCLTSGCHDTFDQTEVRAETGKVVNKHSQHAPELSQCVNCHFTKSATIAFAELPRKPYNEFSAHTFKVIRPLATRQFADIRYGFSGQINTCAEACHRNGRGSRNFDPAKPAAPAFGTKDNDVTTYRDPADIILADSLWYHYQSMYASLISGVQESDHATAQSSISSIAPNPFRTMTTIRFGLAKAGSATVEIYDLNGKLVRFLVGGPHEAGTFSVEWDGRDEFSSPVPAGTYLARLKTKQGMSTQKVMLVR
jgi:hypothetical protein